MQILRAFISTVPNIKDEFLNVPLAPTFSEDSKKERIDKGIIIFFNIINMSDSCISTVFYSSSPLGKGEGLILVPRNMVDSYKEHSSWSRYADYIVAIEDYPSIAG